MAQPDKGFGGRLFDKVAKERGISKSRIYKILALQRLCDEVKKLGDEGKIRESALLEISKIDTPARQKLLADLVVSRNLTVDQVRELAKLVRAAEKSPPDKASDLWDQFFELKDAIESKGMTESLSRKVHQVADAVVVEKAEDEEDEAPAVDPELRKALGFPEHVECVSGRGLDVGTTNIVCAGRTLEGEIHYILQRNAFLDVRNDSFTKRMLIKLGIDHVMHETRMYVIGDPAFELANIFEKETRRPMKDGLISPLESESLQMISMIIHQVLGNAREPGELVYYCVPADPIDADRNVIYHRGALETVLRRQGFTPKSIIEGHSVVMSELEAEDYTGIGVSCGGGMFNVCIAYKSVPALTFSTSRGGDWVDINVGKALGIPASQATAIKEGGVDLTHPRNRQEEAICIYYRELIHYTLATMQRQLESVRDLPAFSHPVELVCAGGTSLIKGFIKVFEEEYQKVLFPIEVKRIRLARDPLRSVSTGCLAAAQEEMAIRTGANKEVDAPTLGGNSRVASVQGEVVSKPKEAKGRRRETGADDAVKILPGIHKLHRTDDPGGVKPVEKKVVSLPQVPQAGRKADAGPAAQIVSMPKAKESSAGTRVPEQQVVALPKQKEPPARGKGPDQKVLPPMRGLAAAAAAGVSSSSPPAAQVVSMPAVPEAAPEEPAAAPESHVVSMPAVPEAGDEVNAEAQAEILPPVETIDAGEAPVAVQPEEQVVQLPAEGLEAQPVQEIPLEAAPAAEAVPVEEVPVEAPVEEASPSEGTVVVPVAQDELPPEQAPIVPDPEAILEYPSAAIEEALAAAAAMGVTGEPIIEAVPEGLELAPFIQAAPEGGEAPPEGQAPTAEEPTQWVGADEANAEPEAPAGEAPPEISLEDEEPPPLPPGPPPQKPKR